MVTKKLSTEEILNTISNSFLSHAVFLKENVYLLTAVVAAIVISLVFLFLHLRKKNRADFVTQSASFTKLLLEHILQNNLVISVQFTQEKDLPIMDVRAVKLTNSFLVLRSVHPHNIEPQYLLSDTINATVLIQYKNIRGYYVFRGKIKKIRYVEKSFLEFAIPKPAQIDKLQRRAHLRVEPQQEQILGMAVWPACIQDGAFVNKLSMWGRPLYRFVPGKVQQVRLINISASGARIGIKLPPQTTNTQLTKKIILLLDLWDVDNKLKIRYIFRCVEQNRFKVSQSNIIELGLRFTGWSNAPLINDSVHFVPISPEGDVPPLAEWVIKRYLEENQ